MTTATKAPADAVYYLQGTLLEACSCGVLCPCWIGEDPDGGKCDAVVAYKFDSGTISGIDVSGLSVVNVCMIPGNVLIANSWRVAIFIDERATDEQMQAILDAYGGKLGGPLADIAGLVGEVVSVERAPISHEIRGGTGILTVGDVVSAQMTPYLGPEGTKTTLRDSIFSTVPGSPAYVGKAEHVKVSLPQFGMEFSLASSNAIQADYTMVHPAA